MKLEFSRQIFGKISNVNFNANRSIGSRVFPCGLMESHAEAENPFSPFLERA